jgi:hypothetical protein
MEEPSKDQPTQEGAAGELHVLLIEDSPSDVELAVWRLK